MIKELAKRGAFVGFDRVTGGLVPDDKKVQMLLAFLDAGYVDNLLLSADYNFTARSAARPGYGSTLTVFVPKLRQAGVSEQVIRTRHDRQPAPLPGVRAHLRERDCEKREVRDPSLVRDRRTAAARNQEPSTKD